MKKLYEKDEIWFAVMWIVIYVLGFGNADQISESIGMPKLITVVVGIVIIIILTGFIKRNHLMEYYGLCSIKNASKSLLYFIPLFVISSVNFWNGLNVNSSVRDIVLYILSMCFVGYLEEVIFRGFLFKGMCKSNVKTAILVSSLTFGVGHIVNLLLGEPVFDTMLQLIYASAIGFVYTAIFYVSGSIWPCIISHAFVNSTSIFAIEPTQRVNIIIAVIQTIISVGYGVWLCFIMQKKIH